MSISYLSVCSKWNRKFKKRVGRTVHGPLWTLFYLTQVWIDVYVLVVLQLSGAPNENIVQNHLNIVVLNVFYYLKVDKGIF